MNPFALHGPAFLAAYALIVAAALLGLRWWRRSLIGEAAGSAQVSDPYAIAYLRGGPGEALRIAMVSLLDRGLLRATDDQLSRAATSSERGHVVERAVIAGLAQPRPAWQLIADPGLVAAAELVASPLRRAGLLLPEALIARQRVIGAIIAVAIGLLAGFRVIDGLSAGRPSLFLVPIGLVAVSIAFSIALRPVRVSPRGREFLADLRRLAARSRGASSAASREHREVLMAGAILGLPAMPDPQRSKKLFPKAAGSSGSSGCGAGCGGSWSSSSCGSSCSSSGGDGGGSSCGGGGCGGGCGS